MVYYHVKNTSNSYFICSENSPIVVNAEEYASAHSERLSGQTRAPAHVVRSSANSRFTLQQQSVLTVSEYTSAKIRHVKCWTTQQSAALTLQVSPFRHAFGNKCYVRKSLRDRAGLFLFYFLLFCYVYLLFKH